MLFIVLIRLLSGYLLRVYSMYKSMSISYGKPKQSPNDNTIILNEISSLFKI